MVAMVAKIKHADINKDVQIQCFLLQIAGLGNLDIPNTRHSVGMALVDRLAKFLGMTLVKKKDCLGLVAEKELGEINLVLLKPKQPMNVNGKGVSKTGTR